MAATADGLGDDWEGGGDPDRMATLNARLDERCREVGRDPREVSRGAPSPALCRITARAIPELRAELGVSPPAAAAR
jgi:hypothetical protein